MHAGAATAAAYRLKPLAGSSHAWAIGEVARASPGARLRVLDVGAATGYVGAAIKGLRPDVVLEGVEPDAAARAALPYDRAQGAVEDVPEDAGFDVVLLLDVIEHVADPQALLTLAARRARPGGTVLVSVPNVAHWSVRLLLLGGRFEHGPSGILDRTHLRFFTRRSFLRTLREAGLAVEAEAASITPIELAVPWLMRVPGFRPFAWLRRALAWLAPGLFAFQLLARCRRGP